MRSFTLMVLGLALATATGCSDLFVPSEEEAIAQVRAWGGKVEPENPSLARPVYRVVLSDIGVSDEHMRYIAGFRGLRLLSLRNTRVTDQGLVYLKRSQYLRRLTVTGTGVTEAGIADLRQSLPALEVRY